MAIPPRIWDIHVHFPRNPQKPDDDPQVTLDHLAERLRETGVVKAGLLCPTAYPGRPGRGDGLTHERCIEMAQKHADLFVPHAHLDPEFTTYERMHQLHAMGYRALKIIGTRHEYDWKDYFPVYRAAEELDMPILFHCGVIGGGLDWLNRHPARDPASAKRMREQEEAARKAASGEGPEPTGALARRFGPRESSATYMRPFHLETIANRFPTLKIIGAHLGGTGNYDEAASVARWRRWVYFDMSGGRTIERHAVERGLIGKEFAIEKLIFGSDCPADEVHEHVERFVGIFDQLGLTDAEKDQIWYRNAAELFGLEESVWAEE
ncbi:MAG: amidohydrolase family protein [Dehalococcoidia bacterium]|nr:amidohydrolase family protein [Dehalococcoidia bacterium]